MNDGYTVLKKIVVFLLINLLIYQDRLTVLCAPFTYSDEILTITLFISAIYSIIYKGEYAVSKFDLLAGSTILIYIILTTISTLLYGYQPLKVSLLSAFLETKWFLLFWSTKYFYKKGGWYRDDVKKSNRSVVLMSGLFLGVIENFYYIRNIGHLFDERHYSNLLTPHFLCAISVAFIAITFSDWQGTLLEKTVILLMLENLIFSTKAKGYGAAVIVVAVFAVIIKKKKKIKLLHIMGIAGTLVIVAWKKIYFYYIWGYQHQFARAVLVHTALKIVKDYFPFGTGWGTYGSYYAEKYYSSVYYLYGINDHRELGLNSNVRFSMDCYLASILGESGVFGAIMLIGFVIILFALFQKIFEYNNQICAAGLLCVAYIMITFLEESGFANPALTLLAIACGVLTAQGELLCGKEWDSNVRGI